MRVVLSWACVRSAKYLMMEYVVEELYDHTALNQTHARLSLRRP